MTLKNLLHLKVNSTLARRILRRFYHEGDICVVRVGPLRGSRLVYHASVNFHAVLGLWDLDIFSYLQKVMIDGKLLGPQSIVADVGANIGFYALWFAARVQTVYAFEPAPEPRTILADNIAINNAQNVSIVATACGRDDGTTDFFIADHHHSSSMHAAWARSDRLEAPKRITVPVTSLDSYFGEKLGTWPDLIKMDIEGGGTFALPGASVCFSQKRPFVLVESHTPEEDGAISNILTAHNYAAYRLDDRKWIRDRSATYPNREGVWGTMFLCPEERQRDVLAAM